jgi:hypothetical protein
MHALCLQCLALVLGVAGMLLDVMGVAAGWRLHIWCTFGGGGVKGCLQARCCSAC